MLHRYCHNAAEVMDVLETWPFDLLPLALAARLADDVLDARIVWC